MVPWGKEEGSMSLFDRLRRKGSRQGPEREPEEKDLATLTEELRGAQVLASFARRGSDAEVFLEKELREAEQKVIAALDDPLQQRIFTILAKHKFNLLEFLDRDWVEVLRDAFQRVTEFLGKPYVEEGKCRDYPFSGQELYLWLLQRAKESPNSEERLGSIFAPLGGDNICGVTLTSKARQSLVWWMMVVFIGEFVKQSAVFLDIICDVPGGEEFIKEKLLDRV